MENPEKSKQQKQFPVRNFMVEYSMHKKHEINECYPDGDYRFLSGWLSQKHPYGYEVEYFSTLQDATDAVQRCIAKNPQPEGHWLTFKIFSLTEVQPLSQGDTRK